MRVSGTGLIGRPGRLALPQRATCRWRLRAGHVPPLPTASSARL